MKDHSSAADGLWHFALRLYAAPGVAPACLLLQSGSGVDVPVLIFAAWAGASGRALDSEAVVEVAARVADWRREVILPLRSVRTRIKTGPSPAPTPETDLLREAIKAAELTAEQLQIGVLQGLLGGLPVAAGIDQVQANLVATVIYYRGGPADPAASAALATIRVALPG